MYNQKEQEQCAGNMEFELDQLEMIVESSGTERDITYLYGPFLTLLCC